MNTQKSQKEILLERFKKFWESYPKKMSKGQAEKAWLKLKVSEQLLAQIVAKIERARTSVEWTKDGGRFIPHPATWLNASGWEDEYTPISVDGNGKNTPEPTGLDALRALREEEGRG